MLETWDFLHSGVGSAAFNMALDEALLRTAGGRGRPLLRVYLWDKPSVSFGYFQKFPTHPADGYEKVRRPTGGGVVYHGEDTTYTVIAPTAHALYAMKTSEAYCELHRAIAAAFDSSPVLHHAPLQSPRGQYECFQKPVHGDVVVNGRKLAGGAQRRTRSGLLHQGSVAARLTSEQIKSGFQLVFGIAFEEYELADAERTLAEKLARERYGAATWNRQITIRSPE